MIGNNKVALGMSGGVDSAVSAEILKEQGYEVLGITFLFSEQGEHTKSNIRDARESADKLDLQHYIVDLRSEFEDKIIKRFIKEYEQGKTPFPCAFCNPEIKFYHLNRLANFYHCKYIATGHYAQIKIHKGKKYISKGADQEKDQSFFLWGLNPNIIDKLIFPLGGYEKSEVRQRAKNSNVPKISIKKDSMGICFTNTKNYRNFLINNGLTVKKGNFVDELGNIIGKHQGIIHYTVGQRRGLGLNLNKPVFVSEIRAKENEIVISDFNKLYKSRIYIRNIQFVNIEDIKEDYLYVVKIRYRLQQNFCRISLLDKNRAVVYLQEPVAMVAPGQSAVLYDNDRVIGGGFIEYSE